MTFDLSYYIDVVMDNLLQRVEFILISTLKHGFNIKVMEINKSNII